MPNNPVRVIVHAGFHKTGTTSLQDFLSSKQDALQDHYRFYGKLDFRKAGAHARIYGQRPFPWRLWRFRRSFRGFLNSIEDFHTIILSRETFSGGMPGHRRLSRRMVKTYQSAARPLATVILAELRKRFGAGTDITFVYTVRDTDDWRKSVHGHLLRSIRLRDDLEAFSARFPDQQGPEYEARKMALFLDPVPVITIRLEDFQDDKEGPAAAILDMLDVPDSKRQILVKAFRSNPGQSADMRRKMLDLNRSPLGRKKLKSAKDKLLRADATAKTK